MSRSVLTSRALERSMWPTRWAPPSHAGTAWTEPAYQSWRRRALARAREAAGIDHATPTPFATPSPACCSMRAAASLRRAPARPRRPPDAQPLRPRDRRARGQPQMPATHPHQQERPDPAEAAELRAMELGGLCSNSETLPLLQRIKANLRPSLKRPTPAAVPHPRRGAILQAIQLVLGEHPAGLHTYEVRPAGRRPTRPAPVGVDRQGNAGGPGPPRRLPRPAAPRRLPAEGCRWGSARRVAAAAASEAAMVTRRVWEERRPALPLSCRLHVMMIFAPPDPPNPCSFTRPQLSCR